LVFKRELPKEPPPPIAEAEDEDEVSLANLFADPGDTPETDDKPKA
jgi:hypothetical protein